MIKINGATIVDPSEFLVTVSDINKTERNANGGMIIERITTKRNIELVYYYLSQADLSTLMTALSNVSFTVEYPDPVTGALKSGTFYVSDRSAGGIDYISNVMRWKDVKFSLMEM